MDDLAEPDLCGVVGAPHFMEELGEIDAGGFDLRCPRSDSRIAISSVSSWAILFELFNRKEFRVKAEGDGLPGHIGYCLLDFKSAAKG